MLNIALTNRSKYTKGQLIYTWLELPFDDEELEKALKEIELSPNAKNEEYFISDFDTDIDYLKIAEKQDIYELNDLIKEYEHLDEYEQENVKALINADHNLEDAVTLVKNGQTILYKLNNRAELAEELLNEGYFGDINDHLISYIDFDKLGYDIYLGLLGGTFYEVDAGIIYIQY